MKKFTILAIASVASAAGLHFTAPSLLAQSAGPCSTVIDCAQRAMEAAFQAKTAIQIAVPRGAVMAFNLNDCPEGWTKFDLLSGRVIVGAGKGTGLTERKLGSQGGEESHRLTVEELPSHSHSLTMQLKWGDKGTGPAGFGGDDGDRGTDTRSTAAAGGDLPHNNMQPFHTLLYCERR